MKHHFAWSILIAAACMSACTTTRVSTGGIACDALAVDTSRAPLDRRPERTSIVFPRFTQGRPSGEMTIWSFVNQRGRVDSVRMAGTVSTAFHLEIRRAAEAARFRPAQRNGCPVASWSDSMVMAFPK